MFPLPLSGAVLLWGSSGACGNTSHRLRVRESRAGAAAHAGWRHNDSLLISRKKGFPAPARLHSFLSGVGEPGSPQRLLGYAAARVESKQVKGEMSWHFPAMSPAPSSSFARERGFHGDTFLSGVPTPHPFNNRKIQRGGYSRAFRFQSGRGLAARNPLGLRDFPLWSFSFNLVKQYLHFLNCKIITSCDGGGEKKRGGRERERARERTSLQEAAPFQIGIWDRFCQQPQSMALW